MQKVSVKEAREGFKALLDRAGGGEEVLILRHGKPVARIVAPPAARSGVPPLEELRAAEAWPEGSLADDILEARKRERRGRGPR